MSALIKSFVRRSVLVFAATLVVGCAGFFASSYNNRGVDKHNTGDLPGAKADYDEAIRIEPQHSMAYNNRGFAKYRLGDLPGAIADYDEAIRIDPQHGSAYNLRGNAKNELGDHEAAIADWRKAAELGDPDAEKKLRELE